MKKLLTILAALAVTASVSSAQAGDMQVNVVSGSPEGTNTWKVSGIIRETLDNVGIQGKLVPAGTCHKLVRYIEGTDVPTVFLHNAQNLVNNGPKGCSIKPSKENYVVPMYKRAFAIYSRKSDKSYEEYLASVDSFKISTSGVYQEYMFKPLADSLGKTLRYVPKKTKDAYKTLLAGDVDFLYTGYTPSIAKSRELTCWGTTFDKETNGLPTLASLLPDWKYNNLNLQYYIYGDDIDGKTAEAVRNAILAAESGDTKLAKYIAGASMVPGTSYADTASVNDFWGEYSRWTEK